MLFTELPGALRPEVAGEIVCVQDEFVFSLMQSLYYDRASDVFVVWVGLGPGEGLRMLRFKCEGCRGAGVYRTVNGPDLTLADLGELKMIRGKRGGSFLFARVGDGEWRLVSALGAQGSELFIDYGRDGFISQVRDSNSRTLLPVYKEGRLTSVVQMWPGMRGKEMGVTIMR
jgi:hypothetical protein